MQKINKRIKVLNTEESESVLDYFKNKDNLIYKNDTVSSLKQMMKILNENNLINGTRKLGKEVKVELHHSSLLTRFKASLLILSSHIKVKNNRVYRKPESDIEILIYEDCAYRGLVKNLQIFLGKFRSTKVLNKNDYLNYVLSHEYGHLKHFEWQTDNKLFCPLTDRKSLFMNLITEPEILRDDNFINILPKFMYKKLLSENIFEDEQPTRAIRNSLSFSETFADIYSLICLKQSYDKKTYDEIKKTVLKNRLKENKLGSPYYTADAIKEFIELEPENLKTKEDINNYVMDISLRNGFKHFINKYNNELENWTTIINKFGEIKGKYKEYEKDLFCEIAFIIGGLVPQATNNNLLKNMEILENEFGIYFGFKSSQKYMTKMMELYDFEINLYTLVGKNKHDVLLNKKELPIYLVNKNSDKYLVTYINDKITFLEKSVHLINKDFSISSMFNYELNNIYYIAGFLAHKEAIKHNVDTINSSIIESYKKLLNNIGIDVDKIENLEEEKQYGKYQYFDGSSMNDDMFFNGRAEAQKMIDIMKNNLSMSSVIEKLKNKSKHAEQNMLISKKGINLN